MAVTASGFSRRSLLAGAAASAGFAILSRHSCAQSATPFALGVANGDPEPDGFVLWTRPAPQPLEADGGPAGTIPVNWEIATDAAMRQVVQRGEAQADDRFAHSVHVEATGLQSNRPYWYRFTALGAQSAIGRARTSPAPGAALDRLRFVVTSCAHYELGYFAAYRHMAAENPDLILFLGDYIYEYNNQGERASRAIRHHANPEPKDLAGYRVRYAQYRTDPELQALHAAAPCLMTWDDHEVQNDYSAEWSPHRQTDPHEFLRRRAGTYQAYYEHLPLRRLSLPNGPSMRIYDRARFGTLAEFHVLDGRQYRARQACPTANWAGGHLVTSACAERDDPARSLLDAEQEAWLFDGFRHAGTRWNIMAQDLMVASQAQKNAAGEAAHWTDSWDGYPACRTRVLNAVAQSRLANPLFLAGDIDAYFTSDLKANFADARSAPVPTEFVGTSVTSPAPPYERFARLLPDNPHIRYFDNRHRGYMSAELTPQHLQVRMQSISDRQDPNATQATLRSWVVEAGRIGAIEA